MARTGRPRLPGNLHLIAIRLRMEDIRAARQEAKRRGTGYQAVVRQWVAEAATRTRVA